jgi:hypothetical protein
MPIIRPTTPEEAESRLKNAFANQDFGSLGGEVEAYPLPDRKALLYSSATSAWAERVLGAPVNPYHPGWQGQKDGIVRNYFGEREAKDISDEDLFGKIASDYQTQDEVLTASRTAAARGESWLGYFRDVEKKGKMPAGRQSQYLGIARGAYGEMSEKIAPYRGTIEAVAGMARNIDTAPEGMDWGAMARELVKVPKEARPYVLEALSLQFPTANSPEELERVKLSFLRGMERFLDTAVTGVESAGETGAGELLRQSYGFDVEAQTPEQKAARADYLDLRDDMRNIATGKLAPLKSVLVAGMDISGAAQMMPMTLGAFVPYVGPAAILGSMQRETYNELRANNPTMSRENAQAIATIAAPFQAVTEVVSDRLLFGKLPNLKRAFSAPVFSGAGIVGQLGGRVALGAGVEITEELVQGMTPLAIQSIASGLKQDVPAADWDGFFEGFADSAPELLSQVLPLALVGAGVGQLTDYRAGRQLARSPDLLIAAQFSPEQAVKISEAANAGNWREAETLMRADWAKVNAKAESPSEVTRRASARVEAVQRLAEGQASQTQEAKQAAELLEKAETQGLIPRVFRDSQGWAVEDSDGAIVRTSSREDAVDLAYSRLDDNARDEAQAMARALEAYSSGADILELNLGKSMDLSETGISEAAMKEAAITEAMLNGMTREQAEKITWAVLGSNRLETVEGVRRAVSRLFAGAGVMDAIEEPVEAKFQAGLEQGVFTSEEAVNFVKIAAEIMNAPELVAAAESSPRGLIEAVSDIVMADTFGQRKDGKKGVAGAVTAGLKARLRQRAEMNGTESKFAAFLAAFRRFFKQVFQRSRALLKARKEGKLSGDFDEFLDNLMNVDPQARHEAAAAQEAMEIADAGNMPFSLGLSEDEFDRLSEKEQDGILRSADVEKARSIQIAPLILEPGQKFERIEIDGDPAKSRQSDSLYFYGKLVLSAEEVKRLFPLDEDGFFTDPNNLEDDGYVFTDDDGAYKAFEVRVADHPPTSSARTEADVEMMVDDGRASRPSWYQQALARGSPDAARSYVAAVQKIPSSVLRHFKLKQQDSGAGNMPFSLAPRITPAQDAEYLTAVESGDMAKAQAMVDEAAKAAGYNVGPVFHGTGKEFDIFAPPATKKRVLKAGGRVLTDEIEKEVATQIYEGRNRPPAWMLSDGAASAWDAFQGTSVTNDLENVTTPIYFTSDPKYPGLAESSRKITAYLKIQNPYYVQAESGMEFGPYSSDQVLGRGHDGVMISPDNWRQVAIYSSSQAKSADPVTRDESGAVIPLSQRFNEASPDIRFSLAPRSLPEVADTVLAVQMRRPAFREAFYELARAKMAKLRADGEWRVDKRGIASKRIGFDSRMAGARSPANIEAERKFRLRSRQRELIDAGMLALAPETLAAYDAGVASLEDVPMVKDMLGKVGKIMSKSAAQKAGKLKTDGVGSAGDYDGAPRLPPVWYAKSGGSMPYEIAQELSNLGHLKDGYADTLWDALRSAIYSTRTANEAFKKARDAVRKVETDALAQAKKETDTWAKDETAKIPTEKDRQMMALRTLDAILSAFSPDIRAAVGGFVKLASLGSDKAREAEIIRRLDKLDEVVEKAARKHYSVKIEKQLKRYKSQKDNSGRISGKLISTATEQVDYAALISDMDVEKQANEGAALEKIIQDSDDSDAVQNALNKLGILRLFETMDLKDSASLESAAEWLEETIEAGKQGKKIMDEARKEFLDDMREDAQAQVLDGEALNIDAANNLSNMNRAPMMAMLQQLRGALSEALWTTVQRLEIIFGEGSKATEYFASRAVAAANKSNDIKRAVSAQQREILAVMFGSEGKFAHARGIAKLQKPRKSGVMVRRVTTKDVTLDMDTLTKLADGTMKPETAGIREDELQTALDEWAASDRKRSVTITQTVNAGEPTDRFMSELQGVQWRLWWNQADSKKQMERDGWSDESITQLDAFLSDESKALAAWITDSYQDAARLIDPIYRRLFNAPLPRVKGYAPIYRMTLSTDADVMDLSNSDMNSGLAAGFTKSRVNTTAPLLEIDALAAFLAHWENVSHWVSHAELMRDMKAVLMDRNVSTAIRQKKGDGALSRLKGDIKTIETNGTNSAKELTSLSRGWRWLMQYRAYKGLAFRLSPIMKQTPALLNPLLADVPAHNYAAGLSRAFLSPQEFAGEVSAMWKSDTIRRRIEGGFSTEARIAQQGSSMTGSQAVVLMQYGMMPMSQVDGGWTALGAAVAFDYYRRGYLSQGATPEMADAYATTRMERMIATSAQPSDIYARSLSERSTNPFMRSMSMFVSDQRKALAIEVLAIRKLVTGKSKNKAMDVQRFLVAHFIQAAVSQTMAGALASMFGDDDDKEREWSTEQWSLALALGPVNGLFVLGRLIDKIGRGLLGLRIFPNNDLAGKAADDLIRGTKSVDELFNPDDAEDVMTSLDALSAATGSVGSAFFGPAAGVVDVSANLAREAIKILKPEEE